MPEIWDKQKAVYEAMEVSDFFEPYLIILPSYNLVEQRLEPYGYEKEYFLGLYGEKNIIYAITEAGAVIDLEKENFDYIFYQRPYINYLPEELYTRNVIKYAKTAYIPYFYQELESLEGCYTSPFYNYLSIFFASSELQMNEAKADCPGESVFLGYPLFDDIVLSRDQNQYRSFLWTPRWVSDKRTGGSNFMNYKDRLVEWKVKHPKSELVMRPHPLTFANMIKQGKMTEEEVEIYKRKLKENHIPLDDNIMISDTFENADVLVTDESSIIIMYFMTGKPIIYCADTNLRFVDEYKKIMDVSYIAGTWNEVEDIMDRLAAGDDYLRERRQAAVLSMKGTDKAAGRILNYLKDYLN